MPVLTRRQSQILRPSYDLTNGLVGWWTFDDNTGRDISGRNNHATLAASNSRQASGIVRDANGRLGGRFFTGSGAGSCSLPSSLQRVSGTFTIATWLNYVSINGGTNSNAIINDWSAGTRNYSISINSPGVYVNCYIGNGSTSQDAILYSTALAANTWIHFAAAINGTDHRLYINGVLNAQATGSYSGSTNASNTRYIGSDVAAANYGFNGTLDDFRIYNRAISAGEVYAIYASAFQPVWLDPMTYAPASPTQYPFPINIPMLGF